jgi:membrane associated rhomboid family serine protease
MIPLRQTLPRKTIPVVNHALVAANCAVFVMQLLLGPRGEMLLSTFGYVPGRLVHPTTYNYSGYEAVITLFTSLFLHGGVVHLVGNMIYLWVFGGAVEEALGHARYAIFYPLCGVVGSLTHTLIFPQSPVPSIGASGSIAGILGAFLVLRPRARIVTLFPLVVYWAMAEVRAMFFLPVWFGMQFFNGALALAAAQKTADVAGIAWWAHVGGFLFGALAGLIVRIRRHSTA